MANASSKKAEQAPAPAIFDIQDDEEEIENGNGGPRTIKQILSQKRSRLQQAGLLPTEYIKNPSVSGRSSTQIDEERFKDPLSKKTKLRLMQTYQDYTVSSAISTLIHYVLGRGLKATIYPTTREQLKTQEEVTNRLNDVIKEFDLGPKSMEEFQNFIDMVDLNCGLYETHMPQALAQSYVFGRSVLWKVRANKEIESQELPAKWGFKEGVPIALRPLDSIGLGQVIVDTKSWEPKIIEYDGSLGSIEDVTGKRKQTEELKIEDLIYFTKDDYNIIPDSYNYGFTKLLDAIPVSENKRRLTKKVFAEINNNQWAGLNVFEIAGMSTKDMQAFANTLRAGRNKITNQPIKVHSITPQFDMAGNLEQLKQLHLNLLMAVKVPSFLMNFEQITNRATTEAILSAWQQTVLEAERNWIRMVLWKYWYKPLIEFYFPDKAFLYLRIKIIQEFQSIEFSGLFEKAIAVNNLYSARIITIREARELLNLPPFSEEQAEGELEQKELVDQLVKKNPDMIPPLEQVEGARQQENQNLAKMEGNQLLIKPGQGGTKTAQQLINKLKRPPRGGRV